MIGKASMAASGAVLTLAWAGLAQADSPPVNTDGLDELEFAVEQMLGSPYEGDPALTVEQRHPWLRQSWDYANRTGIYADQDYDFRVSVSDTFQTQVLLECRPGVPELSLAPCEPVSLDMETFWVDPQHGMVRGRNTMALQTTLAHELAHVFTESSVISRDGIAAARPDLNAVAMLYFFEFFDEAQCPFPPSELLADAMQVAVFPSSHGGYTYDCGYGYEMPQEMLDVVQSLLAGEYPRWFLEEYGTGQKGGFALRRLWREVVDSELRIDPFYKQLWVWQLRDAFGDGYCSWERAADSAYRGGPLPNPWSGADNDAAGCNSPAVPTLTPEIAANLTWLHTRLLLVLRAVLALAVLLISGIIN